MKKALLIIFLIILISISGCAQNQSNVEEQSEENAIYQRERDPETGEVISEEKLDISPEEYNAYFTNNMVDLINYMNQPLEKFTTEVGIELIPTNNPTRYIDSSQMLQVSVKNDVINGFMYVEGLQFDALGIYPHQEQWIAEIFMEKNFDNIEEYQIANTEAKAFNGTVKDNPEIYFTYFTNEEQDLVKVIFLHSPDNVPIWEEEAAQYLVQ